MKGVSENVESAGTREERVVNKLLIGRCRLDR